ncbi:arginine--tRNA ligase [Phascolarctobacterium sp.]|uniref:arginine--tRNA ligase n=1 Tax=Phascolarctobacterium sp. TaxID=2049039 RepID=UPI002A7F282F|nr:arginine--tRNA ligase [Phascolarctobacterium sp.]MDY5045018.1 arginine--tRNA ligase [Phascolarctobacterium sp.]
MDIKDILAAAIKAAAQKAIDSGSLKPGTLPEVMLEVPPQKEFGDFATNFAMQSARSLHCAPRQIAQAVVDNLDCASVEKAEIAGPGFINFYLKQNWTSDLLASIIAAGENYGNLPANDFGRIQVEYVSANPTGPLHIGHARGAAVGSAMVNLLRAAGYDVESEYYINDAGNQMNNLAASVNARYLQLLKLEEMGGVPEDLTVKQLDEMPTGIPFPENGYHGYDIIETAQRIIRIYGKEFVALDEKERLAKFLDIAYKEKLAGLKEDLEAFGVTYDVWFSEKSLHDANKIREAVDFLQERGYIYEQDGALWLKSTEQGDDKDRVVIRDNGVPTYFAADIAYHRNKFERGFARVINLWGADHHGYIARVKAAVNALGFDANNLEVMLLQMVRLYRNGDIVKLSKRTGETITLRELMDEVGTDAARYFFCMRSLDSQLDFDMTLATEKSNENPVYYIQYAYARISSIARQLAEAGIEAVPTSELKLDTLVAPEELALIKKMGEYPELLARAARERAVHSVATYAYELAGLFHSFYNQCRILGVDKDVQQARIALVKAVGHTIRHALGILGVSAPERM